MTDYDRYNTDKDFSRIEGIRREDVKSHFRFNQQFLPVDGEPLKIWLKRIEVALVTLEDYSTEKHVFGKKGAWYCHFGYSSCFICDAFTALRFFMKFVNLDLDRYCWQLNGKTWVLSEA